LPMFVERPFLASQRGLLTNRSALGSRRYHALNGKQTIYQMISLRTVSMSADGQPGEPLLYKHEYLRRLEAIWAPHGRAQDGAFPRPIAPGQGGSHSALKALANSGLPLYLASGPIYRRQSKRPRSRHQRDDFGANILRALSTTTSSSQELIIADHARAWPSRAVSCVIRPDGYVAIENTKQGRRTGGGVASDEAKKGSGSGRPPRVEAAGGCWEWLSRRSHYRLSVTRSVS